MTLHPDVLTDLVILYHAGEASQASRELLEKEALQNPALAAALAATPRAMRPIDAPMLHERAALRRVRQHYLSRAAIAAVLAIVLLMILAVLRSSKRPGGGEDAPSKVGREAR